MSMNMNQKQLTALAQELAKELKTPEDLAALRICPEITSGFIHFEEWLYSSILANADRTV
jgi:hypothetical protein